MFEDLMTDFAKLSKVNPIFPLINSLMELDVALELRNVFKSFGDGHECGKERWRDGGWTVDSGL